MKRKLSSGWKRQRIFSKHVGNNSAFYWASKVSFFFTLHFSVRLTLTIILSPAFSCLFLRPCVPPPLAKKKRFFTPPLSCQGMFSVCTRNGGEGKVSAAVSYPVPPPRVSLLHICRGGGGGGRRRWRCSRLDSGYGYRESVIVCLLYPSPPSHTLRSERKEKGFAKHEKEFL